MGWGDTWPFTFGGGASDTDRIHAAIRSARGVGGTGPVDGLEDSYLRGESEAIAAAGSAMERAALQAFGFTATDFIPVYESIYGLEPEGELQDRRARIADFERSESRADVPSLLAELLAISPFFSIVVLPRAQSTITIQGKWLAPRDGSIPFGGHAGADFVNFASEFVLHVAWDLVSAHAMPALPVLSRVARLLRARLPAWMDFVIHQLVPGFYADGGPDGFSLTDFGATGLL